MLRAIAPLLTLESVWNLDRVQRTTPCRSLCPPSFLPLMILLLTFA
jgi:hypothetical protein